MRFTVEMWATEYGSPFDAAPEEQAEPQVDAAVELAAEQWRPIPPGGSIAGSVLFIDGVRRIDARIWTYEGAEMPMPGLCASYAAGAVRCEGAAAVESVRLERTVFGGTGAPPIDLGFARFGSLAVNDTTSEGLTNALQRRLGALEIGVAETSGAADLIVVDGPLSGRDNVPGAVGFVKTHERAYLSGRPAAVVAALAPGQRTPVFLTQTSWSRYSWYVRLPGARGHPWAGVVRCEAAATLSPREAMARANLVAATLPRFASAAHKDPRAPQNLYPIAGLERALRRRLGDPVVLFRALAANAHRAGASPAPATAEGF